MEYSSICRIDPQSACGEFQVVLVTGAAGGQDDAVAARLPGTETPDLDPFQDLYGAKADPDLFWTISRTR